MRGNSWRRRDRGADLVEGRRDLGHAGVADQSLPSQQLIGDRRLGERHETARLGGQAHDACAAVRGVAHPVDVAGRMELLDEEACGLLRHPRLSREIHDPAAVIGDPRQQSCLSRRDVMRTGIHDRLERALLEATVGGEQLDAEPRVGCHDRDDRQKLGR